MKKTNKRGRPAGLEKRVVVCSSIPPNLYLDLLRKAIKGKITMSRLVSLILEQTDLENFSLEGNADHEKPKGKKPEGEEQPLG